MRIIIIIGKKSYNKTRLMFDLFDRKAIKDVKGLINAWKCSEAISSIIARGRFVKEVTENEIAQVASDLILTEKNAHWTLL